MLTSAFNTSGAGFPARSKYRFLRLLSQSMPSAAPFAASAACMAFMRGSASGRNDPQWGTTNLMCGYRAGMLRAIMFMSARVVSAGYSYMARGMESIISLFTGTGLCGCSITTARRSSSTCMSVSSAASPRYCPRLLVANFMPSAPSVSRAYTASSTAAFTSGSGSDAQKRNLPGQADLSRAHSSL